MSNASGTAHSNCHNSPTIEEGEDLKAQICDCGTIQVHLGPMSLRFNEKSFERFLHFVERIWLKMELKKAGRLPQSESEKSPDNLSPNRLFPRMLAGDDA